jgi:hypothetical protein
VSHNPQYVLVDGKLEAEHMVVFNQLAPADGRFNVINGNAPKVAIHGTPKKREKKRS